jgi:hypothetical protein
MRVAAGLVLVGAVVRDVVRRPPDPDPALAGWGAAIVPVAVPFVVRPEIGVLAISVGAVEGTWVVLAASAALVGLMGLAASTPAGKLPTHITRWASWLSTTLVAVVGVALTVEGIYAV